MPIVRMSVHVSFTSTRPEYPPFVLNLDTDIGNPMKTLTLGKGTTLIATMRSPRFRRTVVALAVPALLLAACGSSSKSSGSGSGSANFQSGPGQRRRGAGRLQHRRRHRLRRLQRREGGGPQVRVGQELVRHLHRPEHGECRRVGRVREDREQPHVQPAQRLRRHAYPITSPTWIIVYVKQTDATQGKALKAFLHYALTDGQALAEGVNFARSPPRWRRRPSPNSTSSSSRRAARTPQRSTDRARRSKRRSTRS